MCALYTKWYLKQSHNLFLFISSISFFWGRPAIAFTPLFFCCVLHSMYGREYEITHVWYKLFFVLFTSWKLTKQKILARKIDKTSLGNYISSDWVVEKIITIIIACNLLRKRHMHDKMHNVTALEINLQASLRIKTWALIKDFVGHRYFHYITSEQFNFKGLIW